MGVGDRVPTYGVRNAGGLEAKDIFFVEVTIFGEIHDLVGFSFRFFLYSSLFRTTFVSSRYFCFCLLLWAGCLNYAIFTHR